LFGHEKGSFTSATGRKTGLFEEAHHGTVFLDEIGEMDLSMQAKLLRVLQERTIRRVGGIRDIDIDVRIIAATNRNLFDKISAGSFREDLYYRVNVFPIHIPPLRERKEDISIIASYFLDTFSRSFGRNFKELSPEAVRLMEEYRWPGNIRELKNVIERICIMNYGPALLPEHLPQEIRGAAHEDGPSPGQRTAETVPIPTGLGLDDAVMNFEKNIISQALKRNRGNVLQTAAMLKIPRGTLRYKMDKYEL
jgi:transcriptional regulator with PAS, ATPase and Fis domain